MNSRLDNLAFITEALILDLQTAKPQEKKKGF